LNFFFPRRVGVFDPKLDFFSVNFVIKILNPEFDSFSKYYFFFSK
jgi:hypothetical protein